MNVFILGPKKSGKTVLAACMYEHIILNMRGRGSFDSVCFGGDPSIRRLPDDVTGLLEGKNWPVADEMSKTYFYLFSLTKGRIFPDEIEIEIVDYVGEYLWKIQDSINNYKDVEKDVLESIKTHELTEKIKGVDQRIKNKTISHSDIKNIYETVGASGLDMYEVESLTLVYLMSKMHRADKLVFLLDGDKVKNFIENREREIDRELKAYADIMQILGTNKKYAVVITKADVMDGLFGDRRFKPVNKWLKVVAEKFKNNSSFAQLINTAPLDIFGTCLETTEVDGLYKPIQAEKLPVWGHSDFIGWITQ